MTEIAMRKPQFRKPLPRKPRKYTVDEFFEAGLPRKMELIYGEIGPFSDDARHALLANWGTDAIVRLTGAEVWRKAIGADRPKRK
jgi:hypothetical protein